MAAKQEYRRAFERADARLLGATRRLAGIRKALRQGVAGEDGRPMPDPEKLHAAVMWFAGGDTGLSSVALLNAALGVPGKDDYPHDPSDLGRCLRLMRALPWTGRGLPVLASRSEAWSALAGCWKVLTALMADEVGIDWDKGTIAPKTYRAMREILEVVEAPPEPPHA